MPENEENLQIQFMREALKMGFTALKKGEIPVGCVIVERREDGHAIIASGSNQTNESRNGTRHAEIIAVESLFADSHIQPLGNLNPQSGLLSNCDLYVTCEPCIMCAAALSKLGIRKVYFGCHNDRFGGNGSILSVHADAYSGTAAKCETIPTYNGNREIALKASVGCSLTNEQNDRTSESSSAYHKYEVEAGLLKDEAIDLFQHFYTSENRRAPEAKRKRKAEKTFNSDASGCHEI